MNIVSLFNRKDEILKKIKDKNTDLLSFYDLTDELDEIKNTIKDEIVDSEDILLEDEISSRFDELKGLDFQIDLYVGGTGSGKTFKAITENDNFIISVPTRQLAYEIGIDYDKINYISTGEFHLDETSEDNFNGVVVYESLSNELLDKTSTLIIDEAHYLEDDERGIKLINNIIDAIISNKKVILLTATDILSDELKEILHINIINLKVFKKTKKVELENFEDIKKLAQEDKTILVFTKYMSTKESAEYYANLLDIDVSKTGVINADIPTSERIETQMKFKSGELKLVVSTNALAQGVNFPADVVIIEYNEYDDWALIEQKKGRAGRPQFSDVGYFHLHFCPSKEVKKQTNKNTKVVKAKSYRGVDISFLNLEEFQLPTSLETYGGFKYAKNLLKYLVKNNLANKKEISAYTFIKDEEFKTKKIIEHYKKS